jgi:ribonuclease Z
MTTTITLTGTGVPHVSPGRAGPGVLVRHGDTALQFDAGRGTVLRLVEAGSACHQLAAMFLTHVHSDHVIDLADVVMTRWIEGTLHPSGPLPIVAVEGLATRFAAVMLEPYSDDIAMRVEHVQPTGPEVLVKGFALPTDPTEVWRSEAGDVRVEAMAVHHEPVLEAVAFRVTTTDGVVVISGDTRVCDEMRDFARHADVLVHEACRATALAPLTKGTPFEHIFDYHADSRQLGRLAAEAGVRHLVLTHLIPAPSTAEDEDGFVQDIRAGGYLGPLTVGHDLFTIDIA